MNRARRAILAIWTASLVLSLSSCSSCSRTGSPGASSGGTPFSATGPIPGLRKTWGIPVMNQPGAIFHVEYSPNTAIVDLKTVAQALRGVSDDRQIFLFQDSPALREKLVPGKCVLFEGLDLRKVDALALDGTTLIVGTETAPLTEALKNLQIQFKVPIDFEDIFSHASAERRSLEAPPARWALLESVSAALDALEPKVYAEGGGELQGDVKFRDDQDGEWNLHFQNAFNPDHSMSFNFQLHRDAEGLEAEIGGKGNLSKFELQDAMFTEDGQFKAASFQTTGLHGTVNFDWTIRTSEAKTPMKEARVKLPGAIKIPLEETGLPMSLVLSEALLFHPAFTNKNAVAKGGFNVSYSGDEGFKLSGSDMEAPSATTGDGAIVSTEGFSPLSAYGVVVAMAVPRVELKMGAEDLFEAAGLPISSEQMKKAINALQSLPLVGKFFGKKGKNPLDSEAAAYFQVVLSTTAAHSGMLSLVPCQQFTLVAKGQVGVDAKWLGTEMPTPSKDLFTKSVTQIRPDSPICNGGKNGS
jgi:hypothetical protein